MQRNISIPRPKHVYSQRSVDTSGICQLPVTASQPNTADASGDHRNISRNIASTKKIYKTKNMYFDEIYNFCLTYFLQFFIFSEINTKDYGFYGFFVDFTMKNQFQPKTTTIFVKSASQNK